MFQYHTKLIKSLKLFPEDWKIALLLHPDKGKGTMTDFAKFITENENADIAGLLLSGKRHTDFDMELAVNTIEVRRKLKKKVPSWYAVPGLAYPCRLSGEQCSSEAAAMYKAGIVRRLFPEGNARVADLTGGLGVDSWAFSTAAASVLYNEMNPGLASAAEHNFRLLGKDNISVVSFRLVPEGQCGGHPDMTAGGILEGFRPDLIYLDPARRDAGGKKVFLMEDCSPDVLALKAELFRQCRHILLKLSPMADISMIYGRLGRQCREIRILASGGECKEILVLMDREFDGECTVTAGTPLSSMQFGYDELRHAAPRFLSSEDSIRPGAVLYEPGKALMKAGAFNVLCERFPLEKLSKFTHYYIMASSEHAHLDTDGLPEEVLEELSANGKFFVIREVLPLNNRNIKDIGKRYPQCEVTARNIKMDTDTLRGKLGVSSGGDIHIFALHCDLPESGDLLLVTSRKD